MSWLQKYDLEIGEKQCELDELTEKFEDEVAKCEELEVRRTLSILMNVGRIGWFKPDETKTDIIKKHVTVKASRAGQTIYSSDGGKRGGVPTGDDGEDDKVHDGARCKGYPVRLARCDG